METRIEKYKLYRQEILNDGLILDKLANESSTIKNYKLKIDELNPKILENTPTNSTISNLVSVDKKDYSEIDNLKDFSALIDEAKLSNSENEINEYANNNDFISVLDEAGNISNKWLSEDKNYIEIVENEKKLVGLSNTWTTFQVVSKDQSEKLDDLAKSKKTYDEFLKYKITPLDDSKYQSKEYKKIYLISLIVSLTLFLIMLVLLILKLCFTYE